MLSTEPGELQYVETADHYRTVVQRLTSTTTGAGHVAESVASLPPCPLTATAWTPMEALPLEYTVDPSHGPRELLVEAASPDMVGGFDPTLKVDPQNHCGGAGLFAYFRVFGLDFVRGATIGGTDDFASACGGAGAPDHFYEFDGRAGERVNLLVGPTATDFDTVLSLRRGACATSTVMRCTNTESSADNAGHSEIEMVLPADGRYTVIVDGLGGVSGDYTLFLAEINRIHTDDFPSAFAYDQTESSADGAGYGHAGDYVQYEAVPSGMEGLYSMEAYIALDNRLTCGEQDVDVLVGGRRVGSLVVHPGDPAIGKIFLFPPVVVGPGYSTIRYQTATDVPAGCGEADYVYGSTIELHGTRLSPPPGI